MEDVLSIIMGYPCPPEDKNPGVDGHNAGDCHPGGQKPRCGCDITPVTVTPEDKNPDVDAT